MRDDPRGTGENMRDQKLQKFTGEDFEHAKAETMQEIQQIAKNLNLSLITMDARLKAISNIQVCVSDINDRLQCIENCLRNKGFLDDEV